jgi:hypothetical protein
MVGGGWRSRRPAGEMLLLLLPTPLEELRFSVRDGWNWNVGRCTSVDGIAPPLFGWN